MTPHITVRENPAAATDESLVRSAQSGDRAAFGQLYSRYARMVHGLVLSKVSHGAADDLVQDVFLRALDRLPTLRDPSRFGGWLAAIARNCAADFYRHSSPQEEFSEGQYEDRAASTSTSQARIVESEAAAILELILTLPEAYRETLILRLVEGMTGPEIAERTGLSHGSVRVNLHRGMQQLREKLGGTSHKELGTKHE